MFAVPVRIEQFLSNITVNATDSFTLNCTVHGVPTPMVSLHRVSGGTDEKLQNSDIETGTTSNGNPYIAYIVAQSAGSLTGEYKCIGENDVNVGGVQDVRNSESTVQVTVNGMS